MAVRWELTASTFDRLLGALDDDRERAAADYEQLRSRLTGLLEWWGAAEAEELADRTFDRVARKLEEGAAVPKRALGAYVRGVARMVFYEWSRQPRPHVMGLEPAGPPGSDETEAASACLDRCLISLPHHERDLVLKYYGAGKKEDVRRRLAGELGISMPALRIRTHRLRTRLEACLKVCLEQP